MFAFATLRPFQRFFFFEYSQASELLYFGSEGRFVEAIPSTAGLRQGSPLATLYFCAYLQPILERIAHEFPEVTVNAFIDDITLASKNPEMLANAFTSLRDLLTEKRLELSTEKCVWFGGIYKKTIPQTLRKEGVQTEFFFYGESLLPLRRTVVLLLFFIQIYDFDNNNNKKKQFMPFMPPFFFYFLQ